MRTTAKDQAVDAPMKWRYSVLFAHNEALQAYGQRVRRLVENDRRFEGHSDPDDEQELKLVMEDVGIMREILGIANVKSRLTPEEKERRIDALVPRLHNRIGALK